jgi:hypothetical protein
VLALAHLVEFVTSAIASSFASGDALVAADAAYRPRNPEESLLYQVVAGELETFLTAQQDHERQVPGFIEREFRSFLDCGVLARGFLRIACNSCRLERLVGFSCKSRGICPSCGGRRMADTAAHLVDHVIPDVPVRQWVLSPPPAVRYQVAYNSPLLAALIRIFIRAIFSSLRRRARACGIPRGQCGAVAFVQRFGSSLNLHPHVHVLVLDGVFAGLEGEHPRFYPLRAPDDPDVTVVAETTSRRTQALLTKKGIGASDDGEAEDPLMRDTPWLAGLYAHGVRGRIATGPSAGKRIRTWGGHGESEEREPSARRCANVDGFSVHANVSLPAHQRAKLENLCRYMLRPPLAVERLERLASGRLAYRMKTPWRDGTTHVIMNDGELIEKLASLVPAPRFHLVRYFGILGSAAKHRPSILPIPPPASHAESCEHRDSCEKEKTHAHKYRWSELMARIFAVDVLQCPGCGSRMRILAAIEDPAVARKILDCLGLPSRPPPVAPARRNRHPELYTELPEF